MSLKIRQMQLDDIHFADEIARLAFNSPQSRVEEFERFLYFQPGGWLVADLNGQPAGLVGAIDYGYFASIGMMVVHPDLQHRGIGSELMRAILHWVEQRGCNQAMLEATPAGQPLYTRLGFIPVDITLRYQYSEGATDPVLYDNGEIHQAEWSVSLAEFDAGIFGADRGRILKRYMNDYPGRSYITCSKNGEINGYIVCRDNQIGPWLAVNDYSTRRLLEEALKIEIHRTANCAHPCQ